MTVKMYKIQPIRREDSLLGPESNHFMDQTWLKKVPVEFGQYFAGFVDGEGSFNVSLRRRLDHIMQWQVILTFNVSQRDITVLALMKHHLGCGRIDHRKDGVHQYIVQNNSAIKERIIPFFDRFRFLSATKKRNYSIFRKISNIVFDTQPLTPEALLKIVTLREGLNKGRGRKRKHTLLDFNESASENPQRLHAKPQEKLRG